MRFVFLYQEVAFKTLFTIINIADHDVSSRRRAAPRRRENYAWVSIYVTSLLPALVFTNIMYEAE